MSHTNWNSYHCLNCELYFFSKIESRISRYDIFTPTRRNECRFTFGVFMLVVYFFSIYFGSDDVLSSEIIRIKLNCIHKSIKVLLPVKREKVSMNKRQTCICFAIFFCWWNWKQTFLLDNKYLQISSKQISRFEW